MSEAVSSRDNIFSAFYETLNTVRQFTRGGHTAGVVSTSPTVQATYFDVKHANDVTTVEREELI